MIARMRGHRSSGSGGSRLDLSTSKHFKSLLSFSDCGIQETPGVRHPRVVGKEASETKSAFEIVCEGSNFAWTHKLAEELIDHNRVVSNDIKAVARFYGIEAARLAIVRELNRVFAVYGIHVDYRHLSLIADAMTQSGKYVPFSRLGIANHPSPFLQMSFETSLKFLNDALIRGAHDDLRSPAASLVCGRPTLCGTGSAKVMPILDYGKR
eukprot:GHVN01034696.1.p3 GENE.GHVN01034696.1~~GHVN01034696.1.p3  ORF type:complete len:210 (-),score=21.17 GHVN01034696.1:61-690(-)